MKKPKKSSAGNKRQRNQNGQARQKAEQRIYKESSDRLSRVHETKPSEPVPSRSAAGRKPRRDEDERKRKLWERKQSELEARWVAAQARQTEENIARKRTMRVACGIAGAMVAALLCFFAWYFS